MNEPQGQTTTRHRVFHYPLHAGIVQLSSDHEMYSDDGIYRMHVNNDRKYRKEHGFKPLHESYDCIPYE